ncbi:MAG: flagellar biosynthesis anti-sigma factor FlgM [Chloroflexi bacterium]|nr:flagellar biosynthesis anti-sigma factor FlgM [Chloroflexota bacterium]
MSETSRGYNATMNLNPIQRDLLRLYGNRTRGAGEAGVAVPTGASEGTGTSEESPAPRADDVVLSDRAAVLGRAMASVRSSPDLREQLVSAIKARIDAGEYEIPAEALVARLLDAEG